MVYRGKPKGNHRFVEFHYWGNTHIPKSYIAPTKDRMVVPLHLMYLCWSIGLVLFGRDGHSTVLCSSVPRQTQLRFPPNLETGTLTISVPREMKLTPPHKSASGKEKSTAGAQSFEFGRHTKNLCVTSYTSRRLRE